MYYSIYISNDDELVENDILEKGWRGDILVRINKSFYNPTVITLSRLSEEFNNAIAENNVYEIDPSLVLVKQTNIKTIVETLIYLINNGYFLNIKPINLEKFLSDYDKNLQDINSWIKVR